jgi:hypothetical protein
VRFSEHFRDYKYAKKVQIWSTFVRKWSFFSPIEDIMEVLYSTIKGKLTDTMEMFHIYKETHANNQIKDKNTAKPNNIFEKIVREHASGGYTTR